VGEADAAAGISVPDPAKAISVTKLGREGLGSKLVAGLPQGLAEALGWLMVGISNAALVALFTPERSLGARLLHHAIDLGQFALTGAVAGILVWFWATSNASFSVPNRIFVRVLRVAIPWLVLSLVAHWTFKEDLANVLIRVQPPNWLPLRELLALATAAAYLLWRNRSAAYEGALPRWGSCFILLALVAANVWLIPADYPGAHLLVAACAAGAGSLFARRSSWLQRRPTRHMLLAAAALLTLGAVGIAVPPNSPVWRSVLRVPSSAAAPFLSRIFASKDAVSGRWIRSKHPEWMRDWSKLPAVAAKGPSPIPGKPIVILITIDSLRADVVMSGENDHKYTELSQLRDASLCFTDARAAGPATISSLAAMFIGKYYSQIYWSGKGVLPDEDGSVRWTSLLTDKGIHTVNVSTLRALRKDRGITTGFAIERKTPKDYAHADRVMNLLLTEIEQVGDRPAFLYAHFMDIHAPYNRVTKRGSNYSRYLAEVTVLDEQVGRLRQFLKDHGLAERTLLILSADHGEAFKEHGAGFHGNTMYDEVLRVPLIFNAAKLAPGRISVPVTLIDLGPTILDVFGLPAPGHIMGQTLLPLFARGDFVAKRPIASEASRRLQALIFPDGIKVHRDLLHHTVAVYDLKKDPGELNDLNGSPDFPYARYNAGIAEFFDTHELKRPGYEVPWRKF
jgi:arylsulfatase A-like enzyme